MMIKELVSKLNKISDKMKFSVEEHDKDGLNISEDSDMETGLTLTPTHKGQIDVYAELGDHKIILAKIMPPYGPLSVWTVDLRSQASSYDHEGLIVYMSALKIIDQFLADKGNE